MFCPECGAKNDENAVFCENCGARIEEIDLDSYDTSELEPEQDTKVYGGRDLEQDTQVYSGSIYTSGPQAAEAPKKGIFKYLKRSELVMLIVAVVAVIACVIVFNVEYGARQVAEKYVKAVADGDWNTVYDCMSHSNSGDFMTKEAFVTAETINSYGASNGAVTIEDVSKGTDDLSNKTYYITYSTADNGSDAMTVDLKRDGLFWKVQTSDYVNNTFCISVPTGVDVSVDKINLSGKYKTATGNNRDTYTITPVYGITHYVEISGSGLKDTGQLVTSYSSDPTEVLVSFDDETAATIAKQAETDLTALLEAAARDQKVSSVNVINNMSSDGLEDAVYEYEYVRDTVFGFTDNSKELISYQLSNMDAYVYTAVDNTGIEFLQVDIKGDSVLNYNKTTFFGGTETETGTCTCTLFYKKNGTTWLLYSMDLNL